jgi:hypothetical protein
MNLFEKRINTCLYSLILLCTALMNHFSCLGSTVDFATFMQMQQEHYDTIKTGWINLSYEEEAFASPEKRLVDQKERIVSNYELSKQSIVNNAQIGNEEKEQILSELKRRQEHELASLAMPEPKTTTIRQYTFDLSSYSYRLEEKPVNDTSSSVKPRIIVTSEGKQVRYRTDIDQAVIDYYKGKTASDLPTYLGIVEPEKLKMFPANIRMYQDRINNVEVTVFELSTAGKADTLKIYADPSLGYRYRKIEWLSNNAVIREIVASDYRMYDGIPFPAFHEDTIYNSSGKMDTRKTIKVNSAAFNQPIDAGIFTIQYTPETVITDLKLKMRFQPFVEEKDLEYTVDEIINKVIEHRAQSKISQEVLTSESLPPADPHALRDGKSPSLDNIEGTDPTEVNRRQQNRWNLLIIGISGLCAVVLLAGALLRLSMTLK